MLKLAPLVLALATPAVAQSLYKAFTEAKARAYALYDQTAALPAMVPWLVAEIEEFFKTPRVKQGQKTLDQHLERLRINLAFRQREAAKLASYF